MSKTNRAWMGTLIGIALFYVVISFVFTRIVVTEPEIPFIYVFSIALEPLLELLDPLWGAFGFETESVNATLFMVLGLVFVILGCASKPTWNMKGGEEDPQEYLFTHKPMAFLWCLMIPWNSLTWFWQMKKVPVIIPIIMIPFMFPFALVADAILIVLFAVVWAVMTARIKMAATKDREAYEKDTQYAVCPKCKTNFDRPKVKCGCGLVLSYPVPNKHGIKTHTCNNGHKIPCTNKDGVRSKLQMVCPHCGTAISTHEAKPIVISMTGPLGSGKTTMMMSAVESISATAKERGIVAEVVTGGISANALRGKANVMPTKHGELDSEYFFLRARDLPEKQIVINDISGSEFLPDDEKILFEEYYRYNDGIIFVMDPLEVMALHHSQSPTKGSKNTPVASLESFYHMYMEINGFGPTFRSSVPFAVVLTKMDEPRVKAAVDTEATPQAFLNKYSHSMIVDIIGSAFGNVKYFKTASLGSDNTAAEPFLWILSENDADLKDRLK